MSRNRDRTPREHEPAYAVPVAADTVTDAHLVGYLDGEFSPASGASLREVLAERADLAARLAQLERRSVRLSALLRDVSPGDTQVHESAAAMRPHVTGSEAQASSELRLPFALKAAAAIALLLGLALFVPDARAWVLHRIRDIGAAIGVGTREPAPAPPVVAPAKAVPAAVAITFAVARDTVSVGARSLAGVLIVRRGGGTTASAEASGVAARFTVVPGGLQIDGPAAADAVYTLTVPAHVTTLRLERADADISLHPVPTMGPELRIPLTRR